MLFLFAVGIICAAPGLDGAWWRAQVVGYFKDSGEVEIRYVDYGGYERVKIDTLRQIRSVAPLPQPRAISGFSLRQKHPPSLKH